MVVYERFSICCTSVAYRAKRYCYTIPASWNMPLTYKGRPEHRERQKYTTMVFVYQMDFCLINHRFITGMMKDPQRSCNCEQLNPNCEVQYKVAINKVGTVRYKVAIRAARYWEKTGIAIFTCSAIIYCDMKKYRNIH